jgi:hypothetical protein
MKIIIQCSDDDERSEAEEVDSWIRDGEFESDIDISIEVS